MKSAWAFMGLAATAAVATNTSCYVLPSDSEWPSTSTWDTLNTTVNGRLIATVPVGSPCHDPTYDAAACLLLQTDWTLASTQYAAFSISRTWVNSNLTDYLATIRHLRQCKNTGQTTAAILSQTRHRPALWETMLAMPSMSRVLMISLRHWSLRKPMTFV